jgi:ABC-type spermidine/putrescine transport system permease subunit II
MKETGSRTLILGGAILAYAFLLLPLVVVSVFLTSGGIVPLPVEIFQTLQFDFDPRVLAISTIIVILSSGFILAMQRVAGLELVLPGSSRAS